MVLELELKLELELERQAGFGLGVFRGGIDVVSREREVFFTFVSENAIRHKMLFSLLLGTLEFEIGSFLCKTGRIEVLARSHFELRARGFGFEVEFEERMESFSSRKEVFLSSWHRQASADFVGKFFAQSF